MERLVLLITTVLAFISLHFIIITDSLLSSENRFRGEIQIGIPVCILTFSFIILLSFLYVSRNM